MNGNNWRRLNLNNKVEKINKSKNTSALYVHTNRMYSYCTIRNWVCILDGHSCKAKRKGACNGIDRTVSLIFPVSINICRTDEAVGDGFKKRSDCLEAWMPCAWPGPGLNLSCSQLCTTSTGGGGWHTSGLFLPYVSQYSSTVRYLHRVGETM